MKQRVSIGGWLAALVAGGLALASCVPGTNVDTSSGSQDKQKPEKGPVTVEFWTINLKQNYQSYVQGMIDGYEAKHKNVKVKWVDVPGDDIVQKFLAASASSHAPDVVNLAASQVPQFAPSLADVGSYVSAAAKDAFIPSQYHALSMDGRQVGIPWYNGGGWVTWYDTGKVSAAGLDAKTPPTTWAEALQWGKKVHQADDGVYGFNQIPDIRVLQSYGVKLLSDDNKKAAFDTAATAKILQTWKSYYKAAIAPGAITKTPTFPQDFCNGQLAMAVNAQPFQLLNYKKNCPQVYKRLRVAPTVTGTTQDIYLGGLNSLVVPAKSKHQAAATDFALWVASPQNQLAFCKLVTIFPSTAKTLDDPFFHKFTDDPTDQARKIVVEELPRMKPFMLGTDNDMQLEQALSNEIVAYFLGRQSATEALHKASKAWDEALAS